MAQKRKQMAFSPTFGTKLAHIVGRDEVVDSFLEGLEHISGHPHRATLYVGQSGMGKTALLLELAERAEMADYVVARTLASENMLTAIIEGIQRNGERYIRPRETPVKSVDVGAYGFSVGLSFNEATERTFGFNAKLSMLCDALAKKHKGVLILVDEVQASGMQMRELAGTFQQLVGDGKDIAIALAGLPGAISSVLNDDFLTFLNRAHKVQLGTIESSEVSKYYYQAFVGLEKDLPLALLDKMVDATQGYPYLMQLIGYHIIGYLGERQAVTDEMVSLAIRDASHDLVNNVFEPSLRLLSKKDRAFLKAIASDGDESSPADVARRMGVTTTYVQQYRLRLKATGIIDTETRGKMRIVLPYLSDYLAGRLL